MSLKGHSYSTFYLKHQTPLIPQRAEYAVTPAPTPHKHPEGGNSGRQYRGRDKQESLLQGVGVGVGEWGPRHSLCCGILLSSSVTPVVV